MIKRKEQVERYVSLMRIAILDDDPRFSDRLYQKISTAVAKRDWALECQIFSHPQDLLNSDLGTLHAVFLDIDMPEMNGLEVASQIHQHYPDLILVFIRFFCTKIPSHHRLFLSTHIQLMHNHRTSFYVPARFFNSMSQSSIFGKKMLIFHRHIKTTF